MGDSSDDDDVIFVPNATETVDLSTQTQQVQSNAANQSDDVEIPNTQQIDTDEEMNSESPALTDDDIDSDWSFSDYRRRKKRKTAVTFDRNIESDDSDDSDEDLQNASAKQQQPLFIACPICFESIVRRDPVSTMCGHLFCKVCIDNCLLSSQSCPMCKGQMVGPIKYHNIYFNH